MPPQKVDYNALAAQARQGTPAPAAAPAGQIDYAALAAQARSGAAPAAPAAVPRPAPAPAGNTIGPATPAPMSWGERIINSLPTGLPGFSVGDVKPALANSAVGRSLESFSPKIARALGLTPTETVNSPTYESDREQLIAPQYLMPGNPQGHAEAVAKGALTGVGKLTSGKSMAIGAGMAATGGLAAPLAPLATTLKVAGAGAGVYGAGASLYGAGKAYVNGDTASGDEQLGEALPNVAMIAPLAWDAAKAAPDALIRKPLTRATDQPMSGTTITPRMRYDSARRLGAQYDAADATGSPTLGMVKRINRDSLTGAPVYDDVAANNTAAVRDATTGALTEMSPLETAEARGAFLQGKLKANQAGLKDSATNKFAQLDEATGGQPVPGAGQVGHDAQTILQNEMPFYTKYPSVKPSRAIGVLQDLGKVGDTASYSELQRLRSNTHELTSANDDLVKEQGTGFLQTMTGSLDHAITDRGLTPAQASMFRDANGDWADMKEQYDNPSSPLYHAVRTPSPSTLDAGIGEKTPEMLANLRPRIGEEGVGALQRGNTEKMLGNTALDDYNFKGFGRKLYGQPEPYRTSLYGPEMSSRLDDIARTTQGIGTDFNPSGSGKQLQKVGDFSSLFTGAGVGGAAMMEGHPIAGAATALAAPLYNAGQYGTARLMNSPRFVEWLMKQPGETGMTGIPPLSPTTGAPPPPKPGQDPNAEPILRPERPQPTAPARPYAPQVRRDSNIRDIQPLTPKGKPVAAAAAPAPQAQMTLGEQAPAMPPIVGISDSPDGTHGTFDPVKGGTLFHGSSEGTPTFRAGSHAYLTANHDEADAFAGNVHRLGEERGPNANVTAYRAKPGKTVNVDDQITDMLEDGDVDETAIMKGARDQGARYAVHSHPSSVDGDRPDQQVVVSLYPHEDLTPAAAQVKMQGAAENLAKGPDLSHLNQQVPAIDGGTTALHTAGGGTLPAKYRVVEADTLTPSHDAFSFRPNPAYPEGVQERDYFGNRENQLRVIQHAQDYKPAMTVSDNADAINGPPVVTPNGVALGGNSRVMSTQRLYGQDGKGGAAYKDYLKSKAGQFGIDPAKVDQMRKPMLVREVQSDGSTDSLHKLGALLNKPMTGSLSSAERAVSMGKTLTPDTIKTVRGMLDEGDGGSTLRDVMANPSKSNALLMRMQADGLISSEERPQYVDTATGAMNEEGKRVFEKALLGSVMGDANLMEAAPKNITAKLNASIGPLSELGSRPDAWNVIPALRTAIGEHTKMAAANMSVDDYLNQGRMFGGGLSPVEEHLTRVLGQNHNAVRDGFSLYGKDARYAIPGQSTFLGPAPHDAFNYAFKSNLGPEQFNGVKPLAKK